MELDISRNKEQQGNDHVYPGWGWDLKSDKNFQAIHADQ